MGAVPDQDHGLFLMTSRIAYTLLLVLAAIAVLAPARAQHAGEPPYRLIAHPGHALAQVERGFVADAFLKKTTRWGDGTPIRPVDQSSDSPVRRRFSEQVIKRSVSAVKSYWQQQIFSGRDIPPPELDSDDAVVQYVLKHPGGLGYVSASASIGQCKVLTVR